MSNLGIPSKEKCKKILQKYNTPANVIKHCLLVTEISEEFCNKIDQIDKDLVIAGAMLHDIGRSIDHSIKHAIEGVRILERENLDPRVISIVKRHIGTGITKNEAAKLGLPVENYIPSTKEELLVSYSDNLACGDKRCSFEEILELFIRKFGNDSHVVKEFHKQKEIIEKMLSSN
ncbi:MAG: HDIG domain-containing protein [Candidatus Heimdallarchaeota archaeon]|nr:HDIG domain-containing protein [Candidatus Heimdallarchaeota archaeon]